MIDRSIFGVGNIVEGARFISVPIEARTSAKSLIVATGGKGVQIAATAAQISV